MSKPERAEVKKVARDLVNWLKQLLVFNWRQKAAARSQLKRTIEDVLDTGLPRACTPKLYQQKCSALMEHVRESHQDKGVNIFTTTSLRRANKLMAWRNELRAPSG